jgi:hypothetical protein
MAEEERDDYGGGYYRMPGLGELTRGIATERGELVDYDLKGPPGVPPQNPGGPAAVADMSRPTDIIDYTENHPISPRPPALLYQVVSTYDSRPIQGYDFSATECDHLEWNGTPPVMDTAQLVFTVPTNVVAVVRSFRYQVQNAPVNAVVEGDCWLQSDIFVNDLPVRGYNKMRLPVFMRDAFPLFLIVDNLLDIRLQLSTFDPNNTQFGQALDGLIVPVLFQLYGNLILKTGVPIEFEIANAIGGGQL